MYNLLATYSTALPVAMESIAFQALSLVVLAFFCWMIHQYRAQVAECLKNIVDLNSTEAAGIGNKGQYDSFLGIATTLGALSAGLALVRSVTAGFGAAEARITAQDMIAGGAAQWMPLWMPALAAAGAALAVAATAFAQMGVLKTAGSLTLSEQFTGSIIQTKKNWLAAASLFAVPLAQLWTGVNPVRDRIIAYIAMGVAVILIILFVVHTLRGFIKQKVSLLVWFLYLCTVEIFPVCAVALAATKNV